MHPVDNSYHVDIDTVTAQGRVNGPLDPDLLAPVVKSKRTPIACTECRRRQVKVNLLPRSCLSLFP